MQDKQILFTLYSGGEAAEQTHEISSDALNDYVMYLVKRLIQLAFIQSQKEIDDIHQRIREGIETARRNGKQIGQKQGNRLHIQKEIPSSSAHTTNTRPN